MRPRSSSNRGKIRMNYVRNTKARHSAYAKRKQGLLKKAHEISQLCDCEVGLIIISPKGEIVQYSSHDMDRIILKYTETEQPAESRTNEDFEKLLKSSTRTFRGDSDGDDDGPVDLRGDECPSNYNSPMMISPESRVSTMSRPTFLPTQRQKASDHPPSLMTANLHPFLLANSPKSYFPETLSNGMNVGGNFSMSLNSPGTIPIQADPPFSPMASISAMQWPGSPLGFLQPNLNTVGKNSQLPGYDSPINNGDGNSRITRRTSRLRNITDINN